MLIREKLPGIYPQITQAPTNYADFLSFFRAGLSIDDNLEATAIASTMQAGMSKGRYRERTSYEGEEHDDT